MSTSDTNVDRYVVTMLYFQHSLNILVIIDGVWIDNRIFLTLATRNYK
jgi:hypothetical protein